MEAVGSSDKRPATEWSYADLAGEELQPGPRAHWALLTIGLFFVIAVAWAAYFEIDEVTHGEGKVVTANKTQYVQNLEGGIIADILVREGDLVQQGQLLFRIDPTRFSAEFREGKQSAVALQAKIARLQAEVSGKPLEMPASVRAAAPAIAETESSLYRARQLDLNNRIALLRDQMAQRQQELVEIRTRAKRLEETIALVERELSITSPLVKKGVVSEVDVLRLERELARSRTELDAARLAIPRVEAAIDEAKKRIDDSVLAFRSASQAELAEAKVAYERLTQTMPALEDRVNRTEVRSPVKGVVKTIPNKTVGGVVQAGSPLAEIVAVEDALLFEARVPPAEIAFISVGQRAVVKISAYDFDIYGGLEGRVEHISADSIPPHPSDGSGTTEPYFLVSVRTEKSGIEYQGKLLSVTPGMTGVADIITGRRTILYYLLKPVNKARERALTER